MEFNKLIIKNCEQNETIYRYLKRNGFSENYIRNLRKKEGYIKLNSKTAFTNAVIKENDLLELYKNPNTKSGIMHSIIPLNIVYEDDDILVINKPSGLASTPSRSHLYDNLTCAIINYYKGKDPNFVVRIINRLDKDTAGLVCVAKHSLISNLLNSHNYVSKSYFAICTGKIDKDIIINKPIATTLNDLGYNNHKREILPSGKPAITYVEPIHYDGKNTLCKMKLKFGRTHQIRVHLSSIGHALLGDSLYGNSSDKISHTALVCSEMDIYNPLSDKNINLKIDLPEDIKSVFHFDINNLKQF